MRLSSCLLAARHCTLLGDVSLRRLRPMSQLLLLRLHGRTTTSCCIVFVLLMHCMVSCVAFLQFAASLLDLQPGLQLRKPDFSGIDQHLQLLQRGPWRHFAIVLAGGLCSAEAEVSMRRVKLHHLYQLQRRTTSPPPTFSAAGSLLKIPSSPF